MRDYIEEDFDPFYKYFHILYLAARVDMQVGDMEIVFFYQFQDFVDLIYRYPELAFVVTGRDLEIAACHDIGAQADAYRIAVTVMLTELFQVGQAVDVDDDAQIPGLDDLFKSNPIGSIEDPVGSETRLDGQLDLIDGAAVDIGAQLIDIPEYVDISEGLAGVEEHGLATAKGGGKLVILFLYLFCVVDV
jgi:hypothetical protein